MKTFKLKAIAPIVLAISLSACVSTSDSEPMTLAQQGAELSQSYKVVPVVSVEEVRQAINSTFIASNDIYQSYSTKAENSVTANTFYKSVEGKSEDEIKAEFNSLPSATKSEISKFNKANKDIFKSFAKLSLEVIQQQLLFNKIDTKSAFSGLSFMDMPKALDNIDHTTQQLSFISDAIVGTHKIYSTLTQLENAS